MLDSSLNFKKLLQVSYECHLNAEAAVKGFVDNENLSVSIQFMNQAFFCAKQVQDLFYKIHHEQAYEIEQFYHQFLFLNQEFLEALETDHGMQQSFSELDTLSELYNNMKKLFSDLTI